MENTLDLENGLLSFTNPNYNPSDVNSNPELESPVYGDQLDTLCNLSSGKLARRSYARLDSAAMGIVLHQGEGKPPSQSLSSSSTSSEGETPATDLESRNNHRNRMEMFIDNSAGTEEVCGREKSDDTPEVEKPPTPTTKDDGHLMDTGELLYAEKVPYQPGEVLPPGWEKHEDDSGPYYWHISSGTIQRDPPKPVTMRKTYPKHFLQSMDMIGNKAAAELHANNLSKQLKRRSCPEGSALTNDKPIRFAVRSLGWVEIAESDLTPERSSKAVNKCIVDLSLGRNDILDVVGRWGDGKDLYLDLDDYCLRLVSPQDSTVLHTQHIHSIRVWGVGRDNGRERDFAYVARDRLTRKHMCHVFRCDIPARIIANTLRDMCKRIMIERSLHQKPACSGGSSSRPTCLSSEPLLHLCSSQQQFPTPMEEPKKVLRAHYLGSVGVARATGMEVLNAAIDAAAHSSEPRPVSVAVAPSTITISDPVTGDVLAECRVRFLSFLGIGHDVKFCGFIIHTARDQFMAHVFHCEPSSGAMCKTIEAACKLRYQKCLDAHREVLAKKKVDAQNKGLATALRSVFGSLTTRLTKSAES